VRQPHAAPPRPPLGPAHDGDPPLLLQPGASWAHPALVEAQRAGWAGAPGVKAQKPENLRPATKLIEKPIVDGHLPVALSSQRSESNAADVAGEGVWDPGANGHQTL